MSANTLALPPIPLADLPERTKDFIIALCNQEGLTPEQAIKRTLDASAMRAGFLALPQAQPEGAGQAAALAA
jgi:hypothetical protein